MTSGKISRYAIFVAEQKRAYEPPLLWDGLPQAIRNIRTRKKLRQSECAARGDPTGRTTADTWSQWESRTKRLLRKHRSIVTEGLGVTEFELQWEAARLQKQHYDRQAAEIGEPRAIYDSFAASELIGELPWGGGDLPPEVDDWQHRLSNASAAMMATAASVVHCVKEGHAVLSRALDEPREVDREREDPEDPEEEPVES